MTKEKTEWKISANRYVAFIDIMGFKDMVFRLPHDTIYKILKDINRTNKLVESIAWDGSDVDLVRTTMYSDSIVLYSKDDSFSSFDFLVSSVSSLSNALFIKSIPFKGALAFGKMTLDTKLSIFFGQPLIDAYLLQEEISFYGVLFHASVEEQRENKKYKWPVFTAPYLCNLKGGVANHQTIYPNKSKQKGSKKYGQDFKELMSGFNKLKFKTSGHLRKYIDNTEKYLSYIDSLRSKTSS